MYVVPRIYVMLVCFVVDCMSLCRLECLLVKMQRFAPRYLEDRLDRLCPNDLHHRKRAHTSYHENPWDTACPSLLIDTQGQSVAASNLSKMTASSALLPGSTAVRPTTVAVT
jgi:hypothetical protein